MLKGILGCALFSKPKWESYVSKIGHYSDSEDIFLIKIDSPDGLLGA